jgi:type I restriction enzyme S subunit
MSDSRAKVPVVRLGDVCLKIGSGATPRGGSTTYSDDGPYAFVRSQNVLDNAFAVDGLARISREQAEELQPVALSAGDILMSITGNVGRVCQVDSVALPGRVSQHVAIVRPDPLRLDARYLRGYLTTEQVHTHLLRMAAGGTTRSALTKSVIEAISVPAPSLSQQKHVAERLDVWDSAIDRTRRLIQAKKAGKEQRAYALLQAVGARPSSATTIGELALIRSGATPSKDRDDFWGGTHPWVSAKDMKSPVLTDSIARLTDRGFEVATVAPEGSVLVLTRGMTLFRDVPICLCGVDLAFNQDVKALVLDGAVNPGYLAFFLRSRREKLLSLVDTAGHGTGRLDTEELRRLKVLLPPREVQDGIEEAMGLAEREIQVLSRLLTAYVRQRRAVSSIFFPSDGELL